MVIKYIQVGIYLVLLGLITVTAANIFQQIKLPEKCVVGSPEHLLSKPLCTFGIEKNFIADVNITCPEVGILRVVGDYGIFRINCSAVYPLDFNYEGTKPTEAINVAVERIVQQNVSRENLLYQAVVDVFSITFLSNRYKNSSNNVSTSTIKKSFRYSRTGEYIFSGYFDPAQNSTHFYIFFEEPLAEPDFIRRPKAAREDDNGNIVVPCLSTFYDSMVKPNLRINENSTVSNQSYSPTTGFTIRGNNLTRSNVSYICELNYKEKSVLVKVPTSNNESEQCENAGKEKTGIQITPSIEDWGFGLYGTKISCRSRGEEDNSMILTAIGSVNPMEFRLKRKLTLPHFMNRSYTLETGTPVNRLTNYLIIKKALPEQIVSVYCGSEERYDVVTVATIITGITYPFDFNQDWNTVERNEETIVTWFKGGHDHEGQEIYENQEIEFKCRISTFALVAPCIWYIKYKNGSLVEEIQDFSWSGGISYFKKTVRTDMESVICAASLFNRNQWWNATISVNVLDCTSPEIVNSRKSYRFNSNYKQVLNCTAISNPPPKVHWLRDNKILTSEGLGSALLEFPNPQPHESGDYICIANNCGQKSARKSFRVDIYNEPVMSVTTSVIVAIALTICIATCTGAAVLIKFSKKKTGGLSIVEIQDFLSGKGNFTANDYQKNGFSDFVPSSVPYDATYEVSRKRFQIDRTSILGKGASGIVYKCILDEQPVAAKENADITSLKSLLTELKVLMHLGNHENIVKLLGAHTKDLSRGKAYMFVDYCPFGNMNDFLLNGRRQFIMEQLRPCGSTDSILDGKQFTLKDLYNWAIQIATGMAYLKQMKIIHGDLATRNILLTESRAAKITDFGLSNRLYDYAEYIKLKEEHFPWRWSALESMKESMFSCQSDIWSYGVTLWEIFSLAEIPYPNSCWGIPFITQIESGYRLEKPTYAGENLYENVMLQCWLKEPQLRPSFESICLTLKDIDNSVRLSCGYVQLSTKMLTHLNSNAANHSPLQDYETYTLKDFNDNENAPA